MIGTFAIVPAIAFGLGIASVCRKKVLFKRAYRMATSSNLEPPTRLVDHVLRFLRRQYVTCFIASWVTLILINVLFSVFSPVMAHAFGRGGCRGSSSRCRFLPSSSHS
jgi:hypothetical protein